MRAISIFDGVATKESDGEARCIQGDGDFVGMERNDIPA